MEKIYRSLDIIKQSLAITRENPRLLWFPLINLAGMVVICVFFFLPLVAHISVFSFNEDWPAFQDRMEQSRIEQQESMEQRRTEQVDMTTGERSRAVLNSTFDRQNRMTVPFFPIAATYLLTMLVLTFLNVAFYSEILQALNGNAVSVGRGLAFALTKLRAIVLWSLLAGLVGLFIRKIEENVGFVGRWIMALIGISWSVASVFAIPVIIRERQQNNPVSYLKTSAALIKQTWGEGLAGVVSISGVIILMMFVLIIIMFPVGISIGSALDSPLAASAVFALLALGLTAISYLAGVVRSIFLCGLYVYATEGVVPGSYDAALLDEAWKVKKRK